MSINPEYIDVPLVNWTLIKEAVNSIRINKISHAPSAYYYIYIEAGSPAPIDGDLTEATLAFPKKESELEIEVSKLVDIYMVTTGVAGRVNLEDLILRDVFVKDQNTPIIDLYIHQHGNDILLASDTNIDDRVITLQPGHGVIVGNYIGLKEGVRFYEGQVLAVNINDITLDSPLDFAFTTAAGLQHIHIPDMNVNGSVDPVEFHIVPPTESKWNITRIIFLIEDNVTMDTSKFGGIPALTNGVLVRVKNDIFKNIFNIKTNGEFALRSFDISYDDRAPAGVFGFRARVSFAGRSKRGVVIALDGAKEDQIQIIIQDDLTGLTKFQAIAQGYEVLD